MGIIIYLLTDILYLLKIVCLCDYVFRFYKKNKKNVVMFAVTMMFVFSFFTYICKNEMIVFLSNITMLCLFICLIYSDKKYKLIILGVWIYFAISMIDILFTELVHVLMNVLSSSNKQLEELLASSLSLICIYIVGRIYRGKYNIGIKDIGLVKLFLFTILATVDAFVVAGLVTILINEYSGEHEILFFVLLFVAIIGIFIQLASVILLIISRDTYKEKEAITQKYLDEQIKHYEYLEQREKDTKKFRHDIKNHMQVLSTLAKNNMYSNFDEYMEEINVQIDRFGNVITVNNGIVDAIVNKYHSEAVQKGIDITVKGMLPNGCRISAYDLCTIFSNLLSNAIEAAEKSEEKRITIECRYTDDNIIIIAENTFKDEGQFRYSKIVTTKKEVEYHGFGIENIKDAVERNHGMFDINIEKTDFSIMIMLGQEAEE